MASITLKGNPVNTVGELPSVGSDAPASSLTKTDLSEVQLSDYKGKKLILNVFPSIDTPTCATSVREFNQKAASFDNTVVLCISADLPFALGRFCGAEGIANVETASTFRSNFGDVFGLAMSNGPLAGLLSRVVIVVDEEGKVVYTEQVGDIVDEPNYDDALAAL